MDDLHFHTTYLFELSSLLQKLLLSDPIVLRCAAELSCKITFAVCLVRDLKRNELFGVYIQPTSRDTIIDPTTGFRCGVFAREPHSACLCDALVISRFASYLRELHRCSGYAVVCLVRSVEGRD